jgi:alanyl aminopeptidase
VAVPVTIAFGAMENAGMVTYGQTIILAKPESDTTSRRRDYAETAAHELAHQWFGDLVTTAWWNDIWLNEAFATWMEQKLIAEWKPEWKTSVEDVDSKLYAEHEDSLITARTIRQPIESKGDINDAFDAITYQKGAAVIGMFEGWIGPETFRKGVQEYLRRYSFKSATAADFLDVLSSNTGKEVTRAFSTFLDQPGVPLISVSLDCKQTPPLLRLEQKRFLPLGSRGSATELWDIPVCVCSGVGADDANECTLMTKAAMDLSLKDSKGCPAWVEANAQAKGYYRLDYLGGLLPALTGEAGKRLDAAERVDLIGNAQAMMAAGKLSAADALGLAETFHADPERTVVERALDVALSPREDMVPAALMPNYRRFLLKNFQSRARELGWTHRAGESDDARLLRPELLHAMATYGGDQDLARQAEKLAGQWFENRAAVQSDVVGAVLNTAAYYGDLTQFNHFLAEFKKTQDRQVKQRLLGAMTSFRSRAAIEAGMQAVLAGAVSLTEGFPLLLASGQSYAETRGMAFEFVRTHFDQIMKRNPSIFGSDLGTFLPQVGASFCDAQPRNELRSFFGPLLKKYPGATRTLAQVTERIDLCIARKAAQEPSVKEFLRHY